jgi:hypothetical protein
MRRKAKAKEGKGAARSERRKARNPVYLDDENSEEDKRRKSARLLRVREEMSGNARGTHW